MLARWRALPGPERRVLTAAAWRLTLVRVGIGVLGLVRTQRLLIHGKASTDRELESPDLWRQRAVGLQRIGRHLPATRCLARSLTLWWWMRAEGLSPQLRIGVRSAGQDVQGHAWIECDGHLFDETPAGALTYQQLEWKPQQPRRAPEP